MKIKEQLADAYLSYFNDYLTIEKFAEHNRLTIGQAVQVIDIGRKFHDERAEKGKSDAEKIKEMNETAKWLKKRGLKEGKTKTILEKIIEGGYE